MSFFVRVVEKCTCHSRITSEAERLFFCNHALPVPAISVETTARDAGFNPKPCWKQRMEGVGGGKGPKEGAFGRSEKLPITVSGAGLMRQTLVNRVDNVVGFLSGDIRDENGGFGPFIISQKWHIPGPAFGFQSRRRSQRGHGRADSSNGKGGSKDGN